MTQLRRFPTGSLQRALRAVPAGAWSPPSVHTATNGTHGYRVVSLAELGRRRPAAEPFAFVLDEFDPVWSAWLSMLEPGGFLLPHIDAGPFRERWQVPVAPAGHGLNGEAGVAFPVRHWEPHSVDNPGDHRRIHIVIDRAVVLDPSEAPYRLLEEQR